MRALVVLAFSALSGCSFLDQLTLGAAAPSLDPNKIYLGSSRVMATSREVERYACLNGPVLCDQYGVNFACRCP